MDAERRNPGARQATWRRGSSARRPTAAGREQAGRWQQPNLRADSITYRTSRWWLFGRRFGLTIASLGLVTLLVWTFLDVKPSVPLVIAVVSGYAGPLEPLVSSEADRQELAKLGSKRAALGRGTVRPIDLSDSLKDVDKDQLRDAIVAAVGNRDLRGGGPGRGTIIVYVVCVGGVDRDGRSCLVPPRLLVAAKPDAADRSWLRVTDLLDALGKLEGRPSELVVVLDACRPAHGEQLGILDGGFAAAVETDLRNAANNGIHVIVPAGAGKTACALASHSPSPFTAAFIDGVEGCADIDDDGRVTLGELQKYLADEVGRRTALQYGRDQRPFIMPPVAEAAPAIGLAWKIRRKPLAWLPAVQPSGEDRWLADRWEQAQQLRDVAIATRPETWARLERLLLRAERLSDSGHRALGGVKKEIEEIERTLTEPLIRGADLPGLRLARLTHIEMVDVDQSWQQAIDSWPKTANDPATEPPPAPRDPAEWRSRTARAWKVAVQRVVADGGRIDLAAWQTWTALLSPRTLQGRATPTWPLELQAARLMIHQGDSGAWQRDAETLSKIITVLDDAVAAALPSDVRADPLVETTWPRRDADRQRREAYDLAVVGDKDSVAEAAKLRDEAALRYKQISRTAEEISGHWRLLDQIRAELPWLAIWLKEQAGIAADRFPSEIDWPRLMEATRDLERALIADGTPEDSAILRAAAEAASRAKQQFIPLRKSFDESCKRLVDRSAENVTTLAEIRAVLAVPLVMGDRRLELRERAQKLAKTATRPPEAIAGGRTLTNQGSGVATAPIEWVQCQRGRFIDPFVAAIVPEASGVAPTSTADLAEAYASWGTLLRTSVLTHRESAQADPLPSVAASSRRLAVIGDDWLTSNSSATEQIKVHWHKRLVTATEDAVEEFFSRHDRDEPKQWFLAAAGSCLEEARRLAPAKRTDQRLPRVVARIENLERIEQAGGRWAELVNRPDSISTGDGRGSGFLTSTLQVATDIPAGVAALWLSPGLSREEALWLQTAANDNAGAEPVRGVSLPVARPDATGHPQGVQWQVDTRVAGQIRAGNRSTLDARAWFRGHRVDAPLRLVADGVGIPIVWKSREMKPPRISVTGRDRQKGYVTFVFDCSGSMNQDRMARAKEALQTILESLAQTRAWEASIWLYGHRTGWTQSKPYQPDASVYAKHRSLAVHPHPAEDVEQVQPMKPMTMNQVRELRTVMDHVSGWGETPLYLALCEAIIHDREAVPADAFWQIILLTDGVNRVTSYDSYPHSDTRSARDVIETVRKTNKGRSRAMGIDAVALDLKPEPKSRVEYDTLKKLVMEAGGQWRDASDQEKLKQAFRDFLELKRWEVTDASGRMTGQAELGGALATILEPGRYTVRLEGQPGTATSVELVGGEIVELFPAGPDQPLEHRRYDGGTEQGIRDDQSGLEDPIAPNHRWFVAAHLPRREGGSRIRFPISLQNDNERLFSPRPLELWAEVQPQGVVDAPPIVFFDPDFEPGRPVPVIELDVSAWPESAKSAEILVWFSPRRIDPAALIRCDTLEAGQHRSFRFPDEFPGVTLDVVLEPIDETRCRLTVTERHSGARDLPRLRLRLEPTCERAEHVVDQAAGTVTHVFDIPLEKGRMPENTQLSIIDRDTLKERCVKPAVDGGRRRPLRVQIPSLD